MKKSFLILKFELFEIFDTFLRYLPGRLGVLFRRIYIKKLSKLCGSGFYSETGIYFSGLKNISFGEECRIMRNSSINSHNNGVLKIGKRISINYNVNINASDEGYIKIGDDVMIAQNSVLRGGGGRFLDQKKSFFMK